MTTVLRMAQKRARRSTRRGGVIFRPWITVRGKKIFASDYGFKAFPIRTK